MLSNNSKKRKKRASKSTLIAGIILCFTISVNAQNVNTTVDTFLYNKIYKNIAAYNIKHAAFSMNGAIDNSPFHATTTFFYEAFLPDLGSKMVMTIKKSELTYINSEFQLFEVSLDGLSFRDEKSVKSISGIFPGMFFLVARKNNNEVKFISGQFFLSALSDDFKIDLTRPESLIDYLKFKTWCYKISSIKFLKRAGKKLCFSGYSGVLNKNVRITLNKEFIEFPQILPE